MAFRAEVPIGAPLKEVWEALTEPTLLEQWFCEHADVDLDAGRYDFWGRFTPDVPSRDEGRHPIVEVEPYTVLRYQWDIRGMDTSVDIRLTEHGDETLVTLVQDPMPEPTEETTDVPGFWGLALTHGLRGLVEYGTPPGRFDFTLPSVFPDRTEVSVDIDAPREHVFKVLTSDLETQWWVTDEVRHKVALDPPSRAQTPFVMEGAHESILTWTLEDSGGRTRVTLVHHGFGPGEKGNIRGALGWTNSLVWLKFLSEVGPEWMERHGRARVTRWDGSPWM